MTYQTLHFVDPTIPGLSGRDLMSRAVAAVQGSLRRVRGLPDDVRRERAVRRDLAGLDRHLLRDIGIDRGAA